MKKSPFLGGFGGFSAGFIRGQFFFFLSPLLVASVEASEASHFFLFLFLSFFLLLPNTSSYASMQFVLSLRKGGFDSLTSLFDNSILPFNLYFIHNWPKRIK